MKWVGILGAALIAVNHAAAQAGASPSTGAQVRRIRADSSLLTVFIGDTSASLSVRTPIGSFRVASDASALAAWAQSALALRAPSRSPSGDELHDGVLLRAKAGNDSARLVRLNAGPPTDFLLHVTNGAWSRPIRLSQDVATRLLSALLGMQDNEPGDSPPVERVLRDDEVDEPVEWALGRNPPYPRSLPAYRIEGKVQIMVEIGPDGRPIMASLLLLSATQPEFAHAVYESLRTARLRPARKGGVAVTQLLVQAYHFDVR